MYRTGFMLKSCIHFKEHHKNKFEWAKMHVITPKFTKLLFVLPNFISFPSVFSLQQDLKDDLNCSFLLGSTEPGQSLIFLPHGLFLLKVSSIHFFFQRVPVTRELVLFSWSFRNFSLNESIIPLPLSICFYVLF